MPIAYPLIAWPSSHHVCTRAGRGKRKWAVSTSPIPPDQEEIVEGIDVRVLKGPFTKDAEWVLEPGAVAPLICCRLASAVGSHLLLPVMCCGVSHHLASPCITSHHLLPLTSPLVVPLNHSCCVMCHVMYDAIYRPPPRSASTKASACRTGSALQRSQPACLPPSSLRQVALGLGVGTASRWHDACQRMVT